MNSREKIISTASELIHRKGYNHTSIQDILEKASVTKSNFYYHFESKEQLGFEILARRMQQFYSFVIGPSLDAEGLDPSQRITNLLDILKTIGSSSVGELGCPFGNLAQEMSTIHEPIREAMSGFFLACTEALEKCFDEGKAAGLFSGSLPSKEVAEFTFAQIQGAFLLRKTHKNPKIVEKNFEMLCRILDQLMQ